MIHIFDVDHTLYRGSSVRDFLRWGLRRRTLPLRLFLNLPGLMAESLVRGVSALPSSRRFRGLSGLSESQLREEGELLFKSEGRGKVDSDLMSFIEERMKAGDEVVLATSSFDFIVRPLAELLGVVKLIAVELEFVEGFSTGALNSRPPFGVGKLERLREVALERGWSKEECCFYTDSYRDLPLLKWVGTPVAVNPDPRLRRLARRENWMTKEALC